MRTYTFGKNELHISLDMLKQEKEDLEIEEDDLDGHIEILIERFMRRKQVRELVERWGEKRGLEGIAILKAHGNPYAHPWRFNDGKRENLHVQRWVNNKDGKKAGLFLYSCNERNKYEIRSRSSIVIHFSGSVNYDEFIDGHPLRLFVPGEGYFWENQRKLRRILDNEKYFQKGNLW